MYTKLSTVVGSVALACALGLTACTAPPQASVNQGSAGTQPPASGDSSAMAQTLAYLAGNPDAGGKKVAYLTECAAANAYCQARLRGAQDAGKKLGMNVTVFDANFDTTTQLQQVQDAIQRGFDGYILSPVADSPGCSNFDLLKATGKPVSTINSPMCGNADYTEGTAGFVGMQTTGYFKEHLANAFKSCSAACNVVAVGGFVGSDLFTRWETALKEAAKEYPNVRIVADQPGNFDPAKALGVVQDAMSANARVDLVVSSWDDMTRGVEQAVRDAGKKPGTDVRIYSVGGTAAGIAKVTEGAWTSTSVLLPYQEAYYGVAQLAKALTTGRDTPGFTYLAQAPTIKDGPGSIFITAANAGKFKAEY